MKEERRRGVQFPAWRAGSDVPGANGGRARRGWSNFAWGVVLLLAGVLAMVLVEWAWDAAHAVGTGEPDVRASGGMDGGFGSEDMTAFIMKGDAGGMWQEGAPPWFAEECLDADELGEVRCSSDGDVVGIISDYPADRLFGLCCERLEERGWRREESGQSLRSAFLKETGDVRWAFLDVVQVADEGVAVFVLEGFDE